jgi:Flp pilus assembly protein TadD
VRAGGGGGAPAGRTFAYTPAPFVPYYWSQPQPSYTYNTPPSTPNEAVTTRTVPSSERAQVQRVRLARPSSSEQRERAKKYLTAGDELFGEGRYVQAVERYRAAARAAPDLAAPHMLQGLALVAHGNYEGAQAAFRRALELQSDWSESDLSLNRVYNSTNLKIVTERLGDELARTPLKPELLLAVGMHLYFAGERDRAATYLTQAGSLRALDVELLQPLLTQTVVVQQADAEPQPK